MLPSGSNQQTLFNITPSSSKTLIKINDNNNSNCDNNETNLIDFENLNLKNDDRKKQLEDKQIKMIEEFLKTSRQQSTKVNNSSGITEAEFQAFFDKHEFGKKPGPAKKLTPEEIQLLLETKPSENNQKTQFNPIPEIHLNRDMVLLAAPQITPQKLDYNENLDVEDLVDEIMTYKYLEKNSRDEPEPLPNIKENRISFVSMAKERGEMLKYFINSQKANDHNNIFDKILAQNQIQRTKIDEKHFPQSNVTENLATNVTEKYFKTNNKREQKALIEELVTKYDIKYLEAVKKIDKVFANFCNLKSESVKSKLKLGPSLYEKSVVLPQIMQRLHQRDTASAAIKSMEMKLILDAAGPSTQKPVHVSQISSKSKMTSGLFPNPTSLTSPIFVNSTFPTTSNLGNIPNSSPRILKTPMIASVKPTMLHQRPDVSNSTKLTASHPKQTALLKRPDVLSSSHVLDHEIPVLKPPELLMEDCNRERLKAHTTHKLYESLVRGDFL